MSQIPPITTGLGNLTPEVWSRMSNSIYQSEQFFGDVGPQRQVANPNPVTFPAKITGWVKINEVSGSDFTNPKRQYYYTWEEVALKFNINTGLTVETLEGGRSSGTLADDDYTPAINGSEIGVPASRVGSFLGINLEGNEYPPAAIMPSVNGDSTNGCGEVDQSGSSDGPLVMLTILKCKQDDDDPSGGSAFRQLPFVGFFYSAFQLDGCCSSK